MGSCGGGGGRGCVMTALNLKLLVVVLLVEVFNAVMKT